jgi:phosphatidylglycerol:prolipoprotein diacylglycerol transferase
MDKVAFQLGGLTIHWYGILVALGFVAGIWTAGRRALHNNLPQETIVDIGPWLILGGIFGARLFYVVSYWDDYFSDRPFLDVFKVYQGGLVFFGGLFGATLFGLIYIRLKKLPLWKTTDVLAPSVALGHSFGRFGCLMNGCCYGKPTESFLGIHFPDAHETLGIAVHPTQIYDAMLNLGLYVFLAWTFKRKTFDGQIFALYLVIYSLFRFTVEFTRGDYSVRYLGDWATPAQIISLLLFTIGSAVFYHCYSRTRATTT